MSSVLWVALALGNVPLFLDAQDALPNANWPTHAAITLPQGWVKPADHLAVLEDGQPIAAQIEVAAKWPDGSPKWVHAYATFRYAAAKPPSYTLVKQDQPPEAKSSLRVTDGERGIQIDTGVIKLEIPRPFAGLARVEHAGQVVLSGEGGPSLVDERGIVWQAVHDDKAEVVVEQQGPTQVTVKATGWYQNAERRVPAFCRFVTRITAFANSPLVKFDHATVFADDMRQHAISELSFRFSLPGLQSFSSGDVRGKLDDKLAAMWFAQLAPERLLLLAQHGSEEPRESRPSGSSERSAGWFSGSTGGQRVVLLTKDFWQKCPKEVKVGRDEIAYYAWPKHGQLGTQDASATKLDRVYKFECFHAGKLLDSRLPDDFFSALESQKDTTECKAEYARAANLCGVAMHNEFALVFLPNDADPKRGDAYVAALQKLYATSPIARVSPAAVAISGVLGPVSAVSRSFPEADAVARDGMLGYARSIERYGDYGWAIYGNTHHDELMNPSAAGVPGGRPSLHRVWNNNHYQHVSTSWRLAALSSDVRLWNWARIATDNYASIGQVRYDALAGRTDGKGEHRAGPAVKYHNPGAFWHCKAFVPWGGRDYGMDSNDTDSGLTGHWPDPSGLLFAWLFDANRWAKEGYELWLANVKFPTGGQRREINTTLVHTITAYEYQPRPETLAAIQGMAKGLMSAPIETQRPGPIWEPTWLSRYHELLPDDQPFNQYIVKSADSLGVGIEGIWSLALSATAYRITQKDEYLRRHAGTIARSVRRVFRDPHKDKRWDLYGFGPGPDRDGHFMMQWPRFARALADAGIEALPPPDEPGHYLSSTTRFDNARDITQRGTQILFWRPDAAETGTLNLQASTLSSGDLAATSLVLRSPKGSELLNIARLPMTDRAPQRARHVRPSTWQVALEEHPIKGSEPGLYSVAIGGHGIGLFQPLSPFPECQVLKHTKLKDSQDAVSYSAKLARGHLVPLTRSAIQLTFTAMGDRDGSFISLAGADGKRFFARSLRAGESTQVTLNAPRTPAGPWLLDAFSDYSGYFRLTIDSATAEPLLFGRKLADIQLIREKMPK